MKLVVDTNIIIAGMLRDSTTRKILLHPLFRFYVPEHAFDEIERHKTELIEKSLLTRQRIHKILDRIKRKLTVVPAHEFAGFYKRALEIMKMIDKSDAPFVALALSFDNDGLWSNDAHLSKQKIVRIWSTGELVEEMKQLEEELHFY